MAQPQWITAAGSLGTIPEGIFYQVPINAVATDKDVFFKIIAGQLPTGIQITSSGVIEGVPRSILNIQGVPTEVAEDVISKFAIRAYTTKIIDGATVVDRFADRTFTITVTGQDSPDFVTPPGNVGTYYDGSPVDIQIEFTDRDPDEQIQIRVLTGELPPGLTLSNTGLISGIIEPLTGVSGTAVAGYDRSPYAEFPFDFSTRSASKNYQFGLEISDGKQSDVRVFEIFVYSKDSMSADANDSTPVLDSEGNIIAWKDGLLSADNTFITADVSPVRTPILLTPPGDLGRVRSDNFFAFKFNAVDFDGDPIEYEITVGAGIGFDAAILPNTPGSYDFAGEGFDRGTFSLPPGLTINPETGWFYGYIPDQGATESTYRFAVRVKKAQDPSVISDFYYFTVTIVGAVETDVVWLTNSDLGTINNGAASTLSVQAVNTGSRELAYRLASGSNSKLPQGLTLQPTGNITGRVSFNTFALDGGNTTFDVDSRTRNVTQPTTFDMVYQFTVNAFAPAAEQPGYQVSAISISNGGSGYTSTPTITLSAPPNTVDAVQATVGPITISNGVIVAIAVGNQGRGYITPPVVTITGGGGGGATATSQIRIVDIVNVVSVFKTFSLRVNRAFNKPYQGLYIKAMPPENDRALIGQLTQNQDIIPSSLVYRADDPNFGVSKSVVYDHAFGLNAAALEKYVESLDLNHYWKKLTLGKIEVAQARNAAGEVIYEAVYSRVVGEAVNNKGESVNKQVKLPYPVVNDRGETVNVVYPNSLVNMRDQVIDVVGQISPLLPAWMTSKQQDGRVLGFTPAWVIAYVKPGQGDRVVYNIQQKFGDQLNLVDFKADRYEIDRRMTYAWNPLDNGTFDGIWEPAPPAATTFDTRLNPMGTYFDGGSTTFITPANTYAVTDRFDKYVLFPKTNILG
jgi:hypothetical protein